MGGSCWTRCCKRTHVLRIPYGTSISTMGTSRMRRQRHSVLVAAQVPQLILRNARGAVRLLLTGSHLQGSFHRKSMTSAGVTAKPRVSASPGCCGPTSNVLLLRPQPSAARWPARAGLTSARAYGSSRAPGKAAPLPHVGKGSRGSWGVIGGARGYHKGGS